MVILENCLQNDWLVGDDYQQFTQLFQEYFVQLAQLKQKQLRKPKIILAEPKPMRFLAAFLAACKANCSVFLCNPQWGKLEWIQVFELVQPDVVWGWGDGESTCVGRFPPLSKVVFAERLQWSYPKGGTGEVPSLFSNVQCPYIMIPTGGSSGKIKFAIHTWDTLTASVQGFTQYFQLNKVNSVCILPLYHVSGLMQFMRCFTTGGKLVITSYKELAEGEYYHINPKYFFISLVPTQLHKLLQNSELSNWLAQFQTVLLGGAPAWNELLEKARYYNIRLSPTYGMTETASQIATLKPEDFLAGKVSCGQILPHAQVTIHNKEKFLKTNQIGSIRIYSQSLCLGYYSVNQNQNYLQVDDLGFLDEQGYLNVVGRNSDKIITGGENVYPSEIEAAIIETQMVADVCVIGVPDNHWGQALTAIYVPYSNTSVAEIEKLLKAKLSKFKIPKHWIAVKFLPRNVQGKVNRQQLQEIAVSYLDS